MIKQVTTVFSYDVIDEFGTVRTEQGSYIGRTPASRATLRRFVNAAIRRYIPLSRLGALRPNAPYARERE